RVLSVAATLAYCAVDPLAGAAFALLAPLTDSFALNLYVTITMGALGLLVLGWLARSSIQQRGRRDGLEPAQPVTYQLPVVSPSDATLTLRNLKTWRTILTATAILLLAAGDCYALGLGFVDSVTLPRDLPWWSPHILAITTLFMATIVIVVGASIALFE